MKDELFQQLAASLDPELTRSDGERTFFSRVKDALRY